jgi:hypothetical protein
MTPVLSPWRGALSSTARTRPLSTVDSAPPRHEVASGRAGRHKRRPHADTSRCGRRHAVPSRTASVPRTQLASGRLRERAFQLVDPRVEFCPAGLLGGQRATQLRFLPGAGFGDRERPLCRLSSCRPLAAVRVSGPVGSLESLDESAGVPAARSNLGAPNPIFASPRPSPTAPPTWPSIAHPDAARQARGRRAGGGALGSTPGVQNPRLRLAQGRSEAGGQTPADPSG